MFYRSPGAFKKPVKDITIPPITQTFFGRGTWQKGLPWPLCRSDLIVGHVTNGFLLICK
jgi:hypothetical protein